jgi:hypothetical protein
VRERDSNSAIHPKSETHGQAEAFAREETRGNTETYRRKTENTDRGDRHEFREHQRQQGRCCRDSKAGADTIGYKHLSTRFSYFNTHTHTHIPTTHPLTNTFLRTALMVSRATTLLPTHA